MAYGLYISDGTTTLNLLTGIFKLAGEGFVLGSEDEDVHDVYNVLPLLAAGATQTNIRTWKTSLLKLRDQARRYAKRRIENNPVWLYYQSEGGTERRALVKDLTLEIQSVGGFTGPLLALGNVRANLAVKRQKWFEDASAPAEPVTSSNVSSVGGQWLPGAGSGDLNMRISAFVATWDGGGGGGHRLWVGIRPLRNGSAGFVSTWECEDGTNGADAADAVDTSASDGNRVTVTFGTVTTLATRSTIKLSDVSGGNYDDMTGEYLVLLRARSSVTATKCLVKVYASLGGNDLEELGDVYIGSSGYAVYEIGRVTLPPGGYRDGVGNLADFQFVIKAERLAGSNDLHLDALILIPVEHMAYIDAGTFNNATDKVTLWTAPDGEKKAELQTVSAAPDGYYGVAFDTNEWEYPVDGGIVVICDRVEVSTYDLSMTLHGRTELLT